MPIACVFHVRMLSRLDYPQQSVFANGQHVVASVDPAVRFPYESLHDCCTLEVVVMNLETKDIFTGNELLTQLAEQLGFRCMEERFRNLIFTVEPCLSGYIVDPKAATIH